MCCPALVPIVCDSSSPIVTMRPLDLILARNFSVWIFAATIHSEEDAALAAVEWLLLPAGPPRRPRCRTVMLREARASCGLGYRWRCRRRVCRATVSPARGILCEGGRVGIQGTLRLLFHFFRGDRVVRAAGDVGVSAPTAIRMYRRGVRGGWL